MSFYLCSNNVQYSVLFINHIQMPIKLYI